MLAGSYDEPIAGDENPETYGIPVTSTSTDHVAADNLRRVNLWYMQGSMMPMERIPGFFGHQTERSRLPGGPDKSGMHACSNETKGGFMNCYRRDYDLLGYKYALMSQLATAGLNNVLCMIPARDESEYELFPKEDISFIRGWLNWTDSHINALKNTVPLPGHDEVGVGLIDGTAALVQPLICNDDADTRQDDQVGYIWLFNPTYRGARVNITLDGGLSRFNNCLYDSHSVSSLSLKYDIIESYRCGSDATQGSILGEALSYGETIELDLDGSSCLMLSLQKKTNSQARTASAGKKRIPDAIWRHAHEIPLTEAGIGKDGNVSMKGSVTVPNEVFTQLMKRAEAYPVKWDETDQDASWLIPHRLLLFLQLNCTTGRSGACDDSMPATLIVDSAPVQGLKAYETRCTECTNANHPNSPRSSQRFNGWYWDVSEAFRAGDEASIELQFPTKFLDQFISLSFENTDTILQAI